MPITYIALGSNLGNRAVLLRAAMDRIAALAGTRMLAESRLYPTAPVGGPPGQPEFLNAAMAVDTALPPRDLLNRLLEIEQDLGRNRATEPHHGPRPIDLDLLLYDNQILVEDRLQIPHPHLHERMFVLDPLVEIAPNAIHPILHATVAQLRQRLQNRGFHE